jgi:hypothetical protein
MLLLLLFYLGPGPYLRIISLCIGKPVPQKKNLKLEPSGSGLLPIRNLRKKFLLSGLTTVIPSSHGSGLRYRYLRGCAWTLLFGAVVGGGLAVEDPPLVLLSRAPWGGVAVAVAWPGFVPGGGGLSSASLEA